MSSFGEQFTLPCVLMRGGTSKAVFFQESALPPPGAARDELLMRVMGAGDPLQIDGLGGSRLSTSKVAIIAPSRRDDADVDYSFVQVDVEQRQVFHDGNCGNISAAVGPYAIDEGLMQAKEPFTTVRIHNVNTGALMVARVPVSGGRAQVIGDCAIVGVPGTAAEVLMDYAGAIGSRTGHLLPTGTASDLVILEDGRQVEVSICDAGNPCVFVRASDVGLRGDETPAALNAAPQQCVLQEIRGKCGVRLNFWSDWRDAELPAMPMLVLVSTPANVEDCDVMTRLFYKNTCHPSIAATGAICVAAAACVPGSVVHATRSQTTSGVVRIGHPSGMTPVRVQISAAGQAQPQFDVLGFARTARRLMAGEVFLPNYMETPR
jgi:2-methylaconitate isomerase